MLQPGCPFINFVLIKQKVIQTISKSNYNLHSSYEDRTIRLIVAVYIQKCVYIHLAMINIAFIVNAIFIIAKCIYSHFFITSTL